MDKLHVWPGIPVPMRLVCLCYLWCVSLSQWEWTWMSGWLLGLCYCKQCAQSAHLSVWKKTCMQIFFACIVTQTLLGITPGLIGKKLLLFLQVLGFSWKWHWNHHHQPPTTSTFSASLWIGQVTGVESRSQGKPGIFVNAVLAGLDKALDALWGIA